ncbi:Paraquat-inducible protein A [hydrothermal vent metagenome]|uniref:Paraquat-inducible protein A n=1 Tax=hydrothermal vent metagenome TaxID=652676 RepID=A0A3B0ZZD5_9ZZZZ
MMTMSKFYFIDNSFSIISGVYELYLNEQYLLFLIITAFSIALPLLKVYVLFRVVGNHATEPKTLKRYMHLMHEYGRWAMLDVMVVAVLIVTVKLGAVASIEVHYGLYVFGTAVLLLMLITKWVVHLTAIKT